MNSSQTFGRGLSRAAQSLWPVVLFLLGWWLWVRVNGYTDLVAPTPLSVLLDIVQNPLIYLPPTLITAATALAGLVLGTITGMALAILVWTSPLLSAVLMPMAVLLRVVPVVAVVPVMIGVLGTGKPTVVAITVIVTFFPAFSLISTALRSPTDTSQDLFRALGASRPQLLARLLLPSSVPNLLTAVRLSAPSTILSAMLAEFLIGQSGLGYLFVSATAYSEHARAWGAGIVATILAVIVYLLADRLERWGLERVS
ncbi:ABC transporter permease [Microbacterium sp. 2MCAF23]|uniref:ABC transporter permease n=1 Tax=Microbacterium sp. 2MCAF23 TaxID=3232985 RepID=UPI003F9DAAF4